MSELKQFNLARTSLLTFINELDENVLDRTSEYFENTIRWHIGNILFVNEKFLFVNQKNAPTLPEEYKELFSSDRTVKDWTIEPPSLENLLTQLEEQQVRINRFDELFWKSNVKFKVPYGSVKTHGDLLIMLSYREAEIIGMMKVMQSIIKKPSLH